MPRRDIRAAARRHPRRARSFWLVCLLWALVVVLAVTSGVGPANAGTQTFKATADAYVSAAQQGGTFGSESRLKVDASPVMRAYVRFTVQNVSGTVTRATLRLYARTSSNVGIECPLRHELGLDRDGDHVRKRARAVGDGDPHLGVVLRGSVDRARRHPTRSGERCRELRADDHVLGTLVLLESRELDESSPARRRDGG